MIWSNSCLRAVCDSWIEGVIAAAVCAHDLELVYFYDQAVLYRSKLWIDGPRIFEFVEFGKQKRTMAVYTEVDVVHDIDDPFVGGGRLILTLRVLNIQQNLSGVLALVRESAQEHYFEVFTFSFWVEYCTKH